MSDTYAVRTVHYMDRSDDRRLIRRLQAGDEDAVHDLVRAHGQKVYQLAMRYMKNPEDAEEVVQDVMMKTVRKAASFRGDAALSSWLYRVTFNTAISRLRRGKAERAAARERDWQRVAESAEYRAETQQVIDRLPLPDEGVLRAQLRAALSEALDELPEIYRAPIVLRDIEGLSTEEASARLRVKDQTLKSRLHRGRLMLRRRLRPFTGGLAMHRATPVFS